MPRMYAPKKMTITTVFGSGITMQKGEFATVGMELFTAGLQLGAIPAPEGFNPAIYNAELGEKPLTPEQKDLFEPLTGADAFDVSEDNDDEQDDASRYPGAEAIVEVAAVEAKPEVVPPIPGDTTDQVILDALRRIAATNHPDDFNVTGIPKARALTRELKGVTVEAEVREKHWEVIAKEIGR